ncbi:MAG: hypothetical protein HYV09_30735 [Deltaproteobacteria bacterium]|nr:hypothetical protein [Deltaproteobacteria bacterium]
MALRGAKKHYRIEEIDRRHFNATARLCGLGTDMDGIIEEVVSNTPRVIDEVAAALPSGFPKAVFEAVTKGLKKSKEALARGVAAG